MGESSKRRISIALAGNPNVGKSSLFNELTGMRQKVSNFAGVTVEKKTGKVTINENLKINLIDLPGLYDLQPTAEDEVISANYLKDVANEIDAVIVVLDATNLKRNLLLGQQINALPYPIIFVINMMDLAEKNKIQIDIKQLSAILQAPVVPMNSRIGKGIDQLKAEIQSLEFHSPAKQKKNLAADLNSINKIIEKTVKQNHTEGNVRTRSDRIDDILLHPVYGYLIFIFILFVIFQAIFSWSVAPMEWIEGLFQMASNWLLQNLPPGVLTNLIANGILAGLGGIMVFIPQIALLFIFIAILEDTGYLSRVSFLLDKSLRRYGLNGKSVIPLLSGTACAVPAIMSARTIADPKERLITIFITPLMSCSARIPVYTLLIAMLTPADAKIGVFNLQGVLMLSLYLIGLFAAIGSGYLLKKLVKSKSKTPFIFEIPVYRTPRWKSIGQTVYQKVRSFVYEAGKVIIAISIILWSLASYGPGSDQATAEGTDNLFNIEAADNLETSYAGILGKKIEPVIKPLGFDWKIGISLITSFAAREVFVGTMATIYAVENEDDVKTIKESMLEARWPDTGARVYSIATICSLLIFYAFALQCMSTIAIVRKETGGWKWPLIQLAYLSTLAYCCSFAVYQFMQ